MDYRTYCPQCGKKYIYYSHEIGSVGQCSQCHAKFPLKSQDGVIVFRIALIVAGFLAAGAIIYLGMKLRIGDELFDIKPPSSRLKRA